MCQFVLARVSKLGELTHLPIALRRHQRSAHLLLLPPEPSTDFSAYPQVNRVPWCVSSSRKR